MLFIAQFQSTPPVRGATQHIKSTVYKPKADFNPRPPCGGRQHKYDNCVGYYVFQSTPPVRGATDLRDLSSVGNDISIHAPRAGGDTVRMLIISS